MSVRPQFFFCRFLSLLVLAFVCCWTSAVYAASESEFGHSDVVGQGNAASANGSITRSALILEGDVWGGYSQVLRGAGNATTTGASVTLTGESVITGDVFGGSARVTADDDVIFIDDVGHVVSTGGVVTLSNSTVTGGTYGSHAVTNQGNATSTGTVTANDSTAGSVYGAFSDIRFTGAHGTSGIMTASATGIITLDSMITGDIYGGYAIANTGNVISSGSVTLSDSNTGNDVFGGWAETTTGNATATGNSVVISDSNVKYIMGAVAQVYDNGNASATDTTLTISGSTLGDVYGGRAETLAGTGTVDSNQGPSATVP